VKVSYQWLSEYVDLTGYSAQDLAEKLTRSGIEVDIVEERNKGVSQVVVGYVKSRDKHPDADKLSVCTVDVGQGNDLQIVCGAKNVDAGQKVPVAVVGATLPGDFRIKKAKLRGVESQGMICSAKELGLNDKLLAKEIQEGIFILPEDTIIGHDILNVLSINDYVLELDLTPNRSDCLSMIGVAYEIAAIIGREVKLPDSQSGMPHSDRKAAEHISVKISAPDHCHHYTARMIEGVTLAASPLWMQNRLMAAGIRPINNIVDITNYVMLEYGQPLHAFDLDQLKGGHIDVRLAHEGEKIVTLDDAERAMQDHMLLITDGTRPVGIAGVMGGANSEVGAGTTRILLESAKFAGSSIRKTSRQLGLRSEASLRFEKEVNPEAVIPALNRAASLMAKYAGGKVADGIVEATSRLPEPVAVEVNLDKVNRYLGTNLSSLEVKTIFNRLHFNYAETSERCLKVEVPSRRGDITRDVDLIEEIARLHGYDEIPTTLMSGTTTPGSLTREQKIRRTLRSLLTNSGLEEVINYSFTLPEHAAQHPGLYPETKPIQLSMPMSEERSTLRTSLLPHLIDVAVYNRNRNNDNVAIFELGSVFVTDEERLTRLPKEKHVLSMLWTGAKRPPHWSDKTEKVDFYDLKGVLEKLIQYFGLQGAHFAAAEPHGYHPGRTADIYIVSGSEKVFWGRIGQLHPALQKENDLEDTYVLEVALEPLYEHADFTIAYRSLPRFPSVGRDIAVVVGDDVPVGGLIAKAKDAAGALLENIAVFDIYTGERLGSGKKSVALSLVYRHPDRTLTDDEVVAAHVKVVAELEQTFAAELRK
jgi:phenylalanyl-tRNA synthetase beta chain